MTMCNHFACRFEPAEMLMIIGKWELAMKMYDARLVPCRRLEIQPRGEKTDE